MDEYENKVNCENLDNKYLESMCLKRTSDKVLTTTINDNRGEIENTFDLANEKGVSQNYTKFYSDDEYRDKKINRQLRTWKIKGKLMGK